MNVRDMTIQELGNRRTILMFRKSQPQRFNCYTDDNAEELRQVNERIEQIGQNMANRPRKTDNSIPGARDLHATLEEIQEQEQVED